MGLAAVAAVLLVLLAAWRPLMLPDEGRYVGVAWEMLRSGRWAVPTLNDLPYFHKPPLFYWITGAAMGVGGLHPLAARTASLAAAGLLAWGLYRFTRRWADAALAPWVLVALATQPLFFGGAQFANLDMLVAACISLSVLAFAHAALRLEAGQRAGPWCWVGHVAAALGVLAKGLIGVVLPVLVIGLWLLARRRLAILRGLASASGTLLFAIIALPWFIDMQLRFDGFFDYFFVVQQAQRFAAGGFNNAQPFWFYLPVVAGLALPWTLWAGPLFTRGYWSDAQRAPLRGLMAAWLGVVFLFFSMPQSKLIGYMLPLSAPLAWLLADAARTHVAQRLTRAAWPRASALTGAALCAVAGVVLLVAKPSDSRAVAQALVDGRRPGDPVIFVGQYPFDLPLLARLREPVTVVEAWSDASVTARDNWRKELADASKFAAPAARARLAPPESLEPLLCASRVSWVVAAADGPMLPAWLRRLPPLAGAARIAVWRVDSGELAALSPPPCPRTPNDGPADR